MNVFNIADPLPSGTSVLEASAGTGKTWTIAALVTRVVAEGIHPITDLLVVTFTRAATQELRSRVRERLVGAARTLEVLSRGESAEVDELTFFLATGRAIPTGDQLHSADQSSFCEKTGMYSPQDGELLSATELTDRIDRLTHAVTDIDAATITTIHGFCHTVLEGLGVVGDTDTGLQLVESSADLLEEVVADLYLDVFSREEGTPPFTYSDALEMAKKVVSNPTATIEPSNLAGDPEAAVIHRRVRFTHAVRNELERRKRDLGILTYDDLLSRLATTLEDRDGHAPEPARERLRDRWQMVLIDEFQDTDDTQWNILKTAFHDSRDLILIGDPKQAIYAFRGGDITTYLEATRVAHNHFTLGHNYRSDAALISCFNGLLDGAQLGHEEIRVSAVSAGKRKAGVRLGKETGSGQPERVRIRVLPTDNLDIGKRGSPLIDSVRRAVVKDVAVDIAQLLTGETEVSGEGGWRSPEASDVAILCHSNYDAQLAQEELTEVGIHAVLSGGTSVFESEAAHIWLSVLDGMDRPGYAKAVGAAALTPFFGHRAGDLAEQGDHLFDDVAQTLRTYAKILSDQGVAAVFEAAQGWEKHSLAARLLTIDGGERLLTDLRHLAELMHSTHPRASANTLATWLREEEQHGNSQYLRRLESDAAAVQILTIHSAKGLQFPFVYLPTVGMTGERIDKYPVFHSGGGRVVDVSGSVDKDSRQRARAEQAGEALRLLYVAMTRAEGQVVAYWTPAASVASSPLHRMLFRVGDGPGADGVPPDVAGELHTRWGAHAKIELITPRDAPLQQAPKVQAAGDARTWTRVIDSDWRRTSYTALSSAAGALSAPTVVEPEIDLKLDEEDPTRDPASAPTIAEVSGADLTSPMAELPMGAQFGSLVHGILETVDTTTADLRAEIEARIAEQLTQWPIDLDESPLAEAIHAVLTTPLTPAVPTTLADLPAEEQLHELDFDIPLHGGQWATRDANVTLADLAPLLREHLPETDPLREYADVVDAPAYRAQTLRGYLTGSIDLVFRAGSRFYVADYKTNWLGPTDEPLTTAAYHHPQLEAAMRGSSYPLQALLYAVALHRYLRWRLPGYDPATHVGSVLYLYVRGMAGPQTPVIDGHAAGVFTWSPPPALIVALSNLLDGAHD